mmetsp:Transcript_997/g.2597  ORF Transcript_997/g.2597 Transcript_997/m.2597 type:complete len:92 (+) Transcript_997:183-458(+)
MKRISEHVLSQMCGCVLLIHRLQWTHDSAVTCGGEPSPATKACASAMVSGVSVSNGQTESSETAVTHAGDLLVKLTNFGPILYGRWLCASR